MPEDLIVPSGQTLDLDANPPTGALRRVNIAKLEDLVTHGFVDSNSSLQAMMTSAREATKAALGERRPFTRVHGTLRQADLGRYRPFMLGARGTTPAEASMFWSVVRELPPDSLISKVDAQTALSSLSPKAIQATIWSFLDVTIKSGANLALIGATFNCRHFVIEHTGRLLVKGTGLYLKASSIQGL